MNRIMLRTTIASAVALATSAAAGAQRGQTGAMRTPDAFSAWRVDAKRRRLIGVSTSGLRCPRGGIVTLDGGT